MENESEKYSDDSLYLASAKSPKLRVQISGLKSQFHHLLALPFDLQEVTQPRILHLISV